MTSSCMFGAALFSRVYLTLEKNAGKQELSPEIQFGSRHISQPLHSGVTSCARTALIGKY